MRVAYVVASFPVTSETFISQEIRDHLDAGVDLEVIVLRSEKIRAFAPEEIHPKLAGKVHYYSYPLAAKDQVKAIASKGIRKPASILNGMKAGKHRKPSDVFMAMAMTPQPRTYDIVHAHFGNMGVTAASLKELDLLRGPLVVTIHGFDLSRSGYNAGGYVQRLSRGAGLLLPVNTIWRDELVAKGCPADKVRVHHMGVDLSELDQLHPRRSDRTDFNISMVARFVEKKGHSFLIMAVRRVLDRCPDLEISVNLVGDGPLLAGSKGLVEQLGLNDVVSFAGALKHRDALQVIADSDAFVLPSVTASNGNMEGIPVSLMEAMALRKPVISTRHSGIPELVESGSEGLLVEERDVDGLADAIVTLARDRSLRDKLAQGGRQKVEQQFDARKLGQELRRLYDELSVQATA